jgi:ABC-2 family transporter protein
MSLRRILAIVAKDVRDAIRDGRIVVLLILPIGMAIFYNQTVDDDEKLPGADVALVGPSSARLGSELKRTAGKSIELKIRRADDKQAARRLVASEDVDLAVVAGAGNQAQVLLPENATPSAQGLAALVPEAVTRASGQRAVASVRSATVALTDQKPGDIIDRRQLIVLISILLLVCFVAMLVVPMQMAEELETGTFGALRLAATGPEVLAAKALAGFVYGAGGVALTVVITGLAINDPLTFFAAAVGLIASLVGFGLLFGLLIGNANVINTYGAFLILPLLALGAMVFFIDGGWFSTVLDILPFSQATRLLGSGMSDQEPFGSVGIVPWVVIGLWAVTGWALLSRIATRREL